MVLTERVFVCCGLCSSPGTCAERDVCGLGLDEEQRRLLPPVEVDGRAGDDGGGSVSVNYMIDIETLGRDPSAHILSIGAVAFGFETGILETMQVVVDVDQPGRTVDPQTVRWWMRQSDEARGVVESDGVSLVNALYRLHEWAMRIGGGPVWARGPSFDCVILDHAFRQVGWILPWPHHRWRDCRTIEALARELGWETFPRHEHETAHNALADAEYQTRCVLDQHAWIMGRRVEP